MSVVRNDRQRATDVARDLARAAALLQQLAAQNARLRERVRQVRRERTAPVDSNAYAALQAEAKASREEANALRDESRQLEARCAQLEEEHRRIAHLYDAMHQLHSSRSTRGVVQTIAEVLHESVAARCFGIYLYDDRTAELRLALARRHAPDDFPSIAEAAGAVWRALGTPAIVSSERPGGDACEPPVVIALRDGQRPVGAVVIRELAPEKVGFRPLDHDLFRVLATHAATAAVAARLHTASERKRATMDGLIDLLTK